MYSNVAKGAIHLKKKKKMRFAIIEIVIRRFKILKLNVHSSACNIAMTSCWSLKKNVFVNLKRVAGCKQQQQQV